MSASALQSFTCVLASLCICLSALDCCIRLCLAILYLCPALGCKLLAILYICLPVSTFVCKLWKEKDTGHSLWPCSRTLHPPFLLLMSFYCPLATLANPILAALANPVSSSCPLAVSCSPLANPRVRHAMLSNPVCSSSSPKSLGHKWLAVIAVAAV